MKGWLGQAVLALSGRSKRMALLKGKTKQQGPLSVPQHPDKEGRADLVARASQESWTPQARRGEEGGREISSEWVGAQSGAAYLQHSSGLRAWAAPKETGEALPALSHPALCWQPFPSLQQCCVRAGLSSQTQQEEGGFRSWSCTQEQIQLPGHSSCPKQTAEGSGRFWKTPVMTSSFRAWASSVSPWLGCFPQGETEFSWSVKI